MSGVTDKLMLADIKDVEIRPATAADLREFYGVDSPRTSYSWIATYKGIPACVAGLVIEQGGCIAYSHMKPVGAPKMTIWRTARALLAHIEGLGLPMVAQCDDAAGAFLTRLGFKRWHNLQGTEIFSW